MEKRTAKQAREQHIDRMEKAIKAMQALLVEAKRDQKAQDKTNGSSWNLVGDFCEYADRLEYAAAVMGNKEYQAICAERGDY